MPKLTKTQRNFRKKMKKLVKQGKIKDEYGKTITPQKEESRLITIIGIILLLVFIAYICKQNQEIIINWINYMIFGD